MQGERAASTRGVWDVRRRITIPVLDATSDVTAIVVTLQTLDGVRSVAVERKKKRVSVNYDASMNDYHTIVVTLTKLGYPPLDSWWSNLRGRLYQFTDNNARENANLPVPPCCNKPPK